MTMIISSSTQCNAIQCNQPICWSIEWTKTADGKGREGKRWDGRIDSTSRDFHFNHKKKKNIKK